MGEWWPIPVGGLMSAACFPLYSWLASRVRTRSAVIAGVLFLCVLIRLKFAYLRTATPFQLDYEEGNVLNAALRITNGMTPYPAAGSFPYVINPYGPVGYLLAALGIKVFGVSLLGPRLLVLLAGLGVALCIGLLSREYGVSWDNALPIAVLFFCSPSMWAWLPLLRVDLWAILLSLIGLCVFARNPERWPVAAFCFALALLTKPTAAAAPAACFLELLARRKTFRALRFSVLTGIIVIVGAMSLGGSPFFHLLRTHPDAFSFTHLLSMYLVAIEQSFLAIALLIYGLSFGFRCSPETRLLWLYCGLCWATALSGGKLGSDTNHFIELTAALSMLCALSIQHLIETRNSLAKALLAAVVALAAILSILPQRLYGQMPERAECPQAYAFVRSFPGSRVLSEDVSAVVLSGKPVLVSNPFVVTQLGNSVAWSQGSLDQLADREYFDLILLAGRAPGRWSPAFLQAAASHYKVVHEFQCLSFGAALVPRRKD